jgi:hypothetical protein
VVIRLIANSDSIVTHQHDHTSWLGNQLSNHSELFGEVRASQLHVAVDSEVLRNMHMSPKHPGEATSGVHGPDSGWPTLSFRINAY